MTWRAFLLGLGLVILVTAVDPCTSFNHGYGWTSSGHFPQGPVFLLVVLTVFVNLGIKLVRRRWALRRRGLLLMCALLRKQWVKDERLQFILAEYFAGAALR
jgi:hypothetical protein